MNKKQVIKDALRDLGYFPYRNIRGWGSPYITIEEKIEVICDYLGVEIERQDRVIIKKKKKSSK